MINSTTLRAGRVSQAAYTADRRLYLDKDGKVVEAKDPTRVRLLAPAGGQIPMERARALGLVTDEGAAGPAAAPPADDERDDEPGTEGATVAEVLERAEEVEDPAEIRRLLDSENAQAKPRVTLVEGLEKRLAELTASA